MYIEQAIDIQKPKTRCILYAQAGMGKTSTVKAIIEKALEEGKDFKALVVDVDRSTVVLKETHNVDICYLAKDFENSEKNKKETSLAELKEFITANASKYDLVFFDNVSQLEKNMLTYLGKKGKNHGVPSQGDYQQMQFKIYDLVEFLLMLDTNVIITAWEIVGNTVNADDGQQGYRLEPHINAKIVNYILGLSNTVAHYEKKVSQEDGKEKRFFRLSATASAYAKDQIYDRKWCEIYDLLGGFD